jgi:ribose 5-phosphate isomerase A
LEAVDFERAIHQVGSYAAGLITPGMRLGLGTGRTTSAFLTALEPRLSADFKVVAVCTSAATEEHARSMGIEVIASSEVPLDLDVDGADEIDPRLNLIKGAGGAMVREKVVAERSRRFWVIADSSKRVRRLGERRPVPLEVLTFDWRGTAARIERAAGGHLARRGGDHPFITDNGNYVLDLSYEPSRLEPAKLVRELALIPGVIGHGLFLHTATAALVSDGKRVMIMGDLGQERQLS